MWLRDADTQPQWLRDAFALAHPSALDPAGWAEAKRMERHRIEQAKVSYVGYPSRDRVMLAVAERLSALPDVLIYDEHSPVEQFPCIVIVFRSEASYGTFVPRRMIQFDLTYVINRRDLTSAHQFLDPWGIVTRRLEADVDDALGQINQFGIRGDGRVELSHHDGDVRTQATLSCEAFTPA